MPVITASNAVTLPKALLTMTRPISGIASDKMAMA
jgi:hypothetical protein